MAVHVLVFQKFNKYVGFLQRFSGNFVNCALHDKLLYSAKFLGTQAAPAQVSTPTPTLDRWRLFSAVCLERPPIVTQMKTDREAEMMKLLQRMESEQSVLSDHEIRHNEDLKLAAKQKTDEQDDVDADIIQQTALEAEDAWEAELEAFKPASRFTDADTANDLKSSHRKLDRKLILLVRQKLGDQSHWVLPMSPRNDGESMRQAAERTLTTLCGTKLQTSFLGNAPCGFLKYKYSPTISKTEGFIGAKVFFFKAQLIDGSVTPSHKDISEHVWITKDELNQYVKQTYLDRINAFILDF